MFKKLAVAAALAITSPALAHADAPVPTLTSGSIACNVQPFNWGANIAYVGCLGSYDGNNLGNSNPGAALTLGAITNAWGSYGDWSNYGTTNAGAGIQGPFSPINSGITSGTLAFNAPLSGPFILALKSATSFSLYLLVANPAVSNVNFTMEGVSENNQGVTQALSHATLYTVEGGPSSTCIGTTGVGCATVVPEPSTYALMATGLLGIFGFARRRRNNA